MKISVVTIVYNDKSHIEHTIQSVINQTAIRSIEYLVIDGKSNDGTSEIVARYSEQITRYVCEPDKGIYDAMNKGLRLATGDYIIFMNSGDIFDSYRTVEDIIEAIRQNGMQPGVVYGNFRESREGVMTKIIPSRDSRYIWYGPIAAHQSTLYNLSLLKDYGLQYDQSYKIAADYKLTMEMILASAGNVLKTDVCVSDFDISGVSNTNKNKGLKEANRVRKEVLGWGFIRISLVTLLLLSARYCKKFFLPLYKLMRY